MLLMDIKYLITIPQSLICIKPPLAYFRSSQCVLLHQPGGGPGHWGCGGCRRVCEHSGSSVSPRSVNALLLSPVFIQVLTRGCLARAMSVDWAHAVLHWSCILVCHTELFTAGVGLSGCVAGINEVRQKEVFRILSGILHMGNLIFQEEDDRETCFLPVCIPSSLPPTCITHVSNSQLPTRTSNLGSL